MELGVDDRPEFDLTAKSARHIRGVTVLDYVGVGRHLV
jgi:hypothetical protein